MKQITQIQMAEILGVTPAYVCQILTGKLPVSWKMAEKLSDLFPGRSIREWKYAKPTDVKRAFAQYEEA